MTSLGEEHNPYAAPEADLQVQSVQSGPAVLYPMSPLKVALMSVLTFSFYDIVFWFLHWTRVKESGQDVSPIARTIFAPFMAFSFLTTVSSLRFARGLESDALLRATPFVYLVLKLTSRFADKALEGTTGLALSAVACVGGAWMLATIQHGANEVLNADNYRGPSNSGITWGAVVAGAIGLVLWIAVILEAVSPELLEEAE